MLGVLETAQIAENVQFLVEKTQNKNSVLSEFLGDCYKMNLSSPNYGVVNMQQTFTRTCKFKIIS